MARRSPLLFILAGMIAAALPGRGVAQAQPATAGVGAESTLEEVVVTAQKREQSLQDVPLAVSAFGGDQLLALGLNNPAELRFVSPSVAFTNSTNTRGEGIAIRGVGSQIFGDGVEQSVGVVIDGVAMGRGGMGTMNLIDIQRVEVLRGPQGMLFGKNASAGVVSIITRNPDLREDSLEFRGSYATQNEFKTNLTGNLALSDTAAVRLAYSGTDRDGIVYDIQRKRELNDRNDDAVRGKFLWRPSDKLAMVLSGDWAESNTLCCAFTARSAAPGQAFAALNAAAGIVPSPENLTIAAGGDYFQDIKSWGTSLDVDYDLEWAAFKSITGYREFETADNNDPDILPVNILDTNNAFNDVKQFSQEFRLTSPSGQAVEWLAGLFYFDMDNHGEATQAGTLGTAFILGNTRISDTHNESVAAYGELAYNFTEEFKVSASGRYTDEELSYDNTQKVAAGAVAGIPGRYVGSILGASKKETNFSWRLAAQYEVTPDVMMFASAAKGYKGPAYEQQPASSTPVFVEPEIPTSYELGLRSMLFDGTTIFNVTVFKTDFDNFQAQAFDPSVTPARFTVVNAGGLRTKGVEADLTIAPTKDFRFTANVTYLDAEFTEYTNVACYIGQPILPYGTVRTSPRECIRVSATGAGVTEGTGLPPPDAPKLVYKLAADYVHPVGSVLLRASANWYWRDETVFGSNGDPYLKEDPYGLLGASIGVSSQDDRWSVSLFAKNLLDKHFVNRVIPMPVLNSPATAPLGSYAQFPSLEAEQIVGVTVSFKLAR